MSAAVCGLGSAGPMPGSGSFGLVPGRPTVAAGGGVDGSAVKGYSPSGGPCPGAATRWGGRNGVLCLQRTLGKVLRGKKKHPTTKRQCRQSAAGWITSRVQVQGRLQIACRPAHTDTRIFSRVSSVPSLMVREPNFRRASVYLDRQINVNVNSQTLPGIQKVYQAISAFACMRESARAWRMLMNGLQRTKTSHTPA